MSEAPRLVPPRCSAHAKAWGRWPGAFGSRFFLALLVGFVWLGPAWWNARFAFAILGWDALVLVLWWQDWLRLPHPEQLQVAREWTEPASLGVSSRVTLELSSETAGRLTAVVEDEVPNSLRREVPTVALAVSSGRSASGAYDIRPTERGDARLGRVFLRYHGPLELAERRAVADLSQTLRIYPNLQEAKRLSLYLIRSRQIELEKRLLHQRERGREFESLREYRDGDEPRDICWTATARRAKLATKVYQAERSQSVLLVVDAGRLMLARSGPFNKLDYATTAALSLAQVALAGGDAVGLLAYGRRIQAQVKAARGSAHMRAILEQLALVHGELVEAAHARACEALLTRLRRRTLIVWVTDLAETAATPEVIESAMRLLPRHLVLFVAMGQPELNELLAQRPESTRDMYRYVAGLELVERRELLLRRLRQQGALALECAPGRLAVGLVNQYLQIKERSLL